MSISFELEPLLEWALASVRMLALFSAAPILGHRAMPKRMQLLLALAISALVAPSWGGDTRLLEKGALELGGMVLSEGLIGAAMGFMARVIFAAFAVLGEFISIQGGLGAARVLDPSSGASSVALAAAFRVFALLTYLAIDGHHALLLSAAESFQHLPLGGGAPPVEALGAIGQTGSLIYGLAMRLALPVTVAMLVANAGLGLLGRAIPQLNLMTLQLPAHVAFLLLLVALGARELVDAVGESVLPWLNGLSLTLAGGP